jgi:hypothetical protein
MPSRNEIAAILACCCKAGGSGSGPRLPPSGSPPSGSPGPIPGVGECCWCFPNLICPPILHATISVGCIGTRQIELINVSCCTGQVGWSYNYIENFAVQGQCADCRGQNLIHAWNSQAFQFGLTCLNGRLHYGMTWRTATREVNTLPGPPRFIPLISCYPFLAAISGTVACSLNVDSDAGPYTLPTWCAACVGTPFEIIVSE